jgi:CBS domain-containing protein
MSSAIASATVDFLRQHVPFSGMDADALALIAARARLSYHPAGTLIVGPGSGTARVLYVLQRGTVTARFSSGPALFDEVDFAPGEAFPISAVVGRRATTAEFSAAADCFTYEIDAPTVEELMLRSPEFRHYCTAQVESLLQQAYRRIRDSYSDEGEHERAMLTPISDVLHLAPVTCPPATSLKEALRLMHQFQIGSVVIVNERAAPLGIFTERDLLRYSAEGRADLEAPIERYMTRNPLGLPATATAHDAALLMARRGIRHLLVLDAGRIKGVVSERALFARERLSMRAASHAIELARDTEGLIGAAEAIRRFAASMLAQGLGAESLTQIISALNDRLTERIITLEAANQDLTGLRWCWIALGSEGRGEQTIATDQDNAIVFEAESATAQARLLRFARAVNTTLDACGFPLCKGGIMAGHPQNCLSSEQWRARFGSWVRSPNPQALLDSCIFFDLRPLAGDIELASDLRAWIAHAIPGHEGFLHLLAENALRSSPPIGFFGNLESPGGGGGIDLKLQGTRVFVDAARVYALATGILATHTATRLREAGRALGFPADELESGVGAFFYLLLLRLRRQQAAAAAGEANRVDPAGLNSLERRVLKESLLQARRLQRRLALDYQL